MMETDKVIVVQLDCLMGKDRMAAFRKSLLDQMKEGLVIIPPWAHVAYVGNECEIEIKEKPILDKLITEIKKWYWQADKQALAKDPCVVDAMIDLFIRTINEYKEGE